MKIESTSRILGIILARTGSSRLPNKMNLMLGGCSVYEAVISRVQQFTFLDDLIFATTDLPQDDCLAEQAKAKGISVIRGDSDDVVSRMVKALDSLDREPNLIVRINCDNPLIMPNIVQEAISQLLDKGADLITYGDYSSLPFGISAVVMTSSCLRKIHAKASAPVYREHVENFCLENPHLFKVVYQVCSEEFSFPDLELTLDYPEDYLRLVCFYRLISSEPLERQCFALIEQLKKCSVKIISSLDVIEQKLISDAFIELEIPLPVFGLKQDTISPSADLVILIEDSIEDASIYTAPRGVVGLRKDQKGRWLFLDCSEQEPKKIFEISSNFRVQPSGLGEELKHLLRLTLMRLIAGPLRSATCSSHTQGKIGNGYRLGFASDMDRKFPASINIIFAGESNLFDASHAKLSLDEIAFISPRTCVNICGNLDPRCCLGWEGKPLVINFVPEVPPKDDFFSSLTVKPTGEVGFLISGNGAFDAIGNIYDSTISELWTSPQVQQIRLDYLNGQMEIPLIN